VILHLNVDFLGFVVVEFIQSKCQVDDWYCTRLADADADAASVEHNYQNTAGLEITVGHRTLSDQILNMSGQFHILMGHDVRTFHQHLLSIHKIWFYKLLKRLKVVTGTVANAAKISSLVTKNSGIVDNRKYVSVHRLP